MKNVIKSIEDFENYLNSKSFTGSAFSRLSEADLAFFKAQLKFTDDGFPYGYWGDIAKNENLNDSELGDLVSSIFGIDKSKFLTRYHHFGTMEGTCSPRPYFNCPY